MNVKSSFSYFLFGRACLACGNSGQKLDPYLCPDCKQALIEYGERPILVESGICLFPMNNITRPLILSMKYKGMRKIASYLVAHSSVGRGGEGLQILRSWGGGKDATLRGGLLFPPASPAGGIGGGRQESRCESAALRGGLLFLPVPVHSARKRERGYNQSEQAALELSLFCGGKLQKDTLKRRIYKPSQTQLGSAERGFNVAGAFEAKAPLSAEDGSSKVLVVVDDVYTTGATTSSCSRALTRAGWDKVKVCALLYESPVSVAVDRAADIKVGWRTEKE